MQHKWLWATPANHGRLMHFIMPITDNWLILVFVKQDRPLMFCRISHYKKGWALASIFVVMILDQKFWLSLIVVSLLGFLAKYLLLERKGLISIIMHKDSTSSYVLQSFIHALVMANLEDKNRSKHLESQSWMDG